MKWFKHFSDASRDEKLQLVRDEFGVEGYGAYWLILEAIAEQMTKKRPAPELELSIRNWRKVIDFSPKKLRKFTLFCHFSELFIVENNQKSILIKCPNMLKIKDEWQSRNSKNSGVAPDMVRASTSASASVSKYQGVYNNTKTMENNNHTNNKAIDSVIDPITGEVIWEG